VKAKNKWKIVFALIVIVVILNWSTVSDLFRTSNMTSRITGDSVSELPVIHSETGVAPDVYFCPADDCIGEMLAWLDAAEESVHCALFEVGLSELRDKFVELDKRIDVKVITDDRYYEEVSDLLFVRHDNRSGLMHNKFCVLDGKAVWTGSFNPTYRGNYKNNNNVVFWQSVLLADAYEAEFDEMWDGVFGKGARSEVSDFVINGHDVEVYFCPEDWCANKVIYALQDAEHSIDFMTFSFTHDEVGKQILAKADEGVVVRGVFEKSQNNKYTEIYKLNSSGISVRWDGNGANMHHKVFIIDNSTVITGSFNPSNNGDKRNDENVLIVHDEEVAELYVEEFLRVWGDAQLG
jgi:phosphatidylserine/phosphatidylglycerophosphate/cardiolipin synthase-like enzyme